jgi:MFS family permease
MPTLRTYFSLTYAQISLLTQVELYVGAIVEPANGLLIDLWRRRWLMAFGAAGIGGAVLLIGLAPTFLVLLLGFALYGASAGPLAHTADVVLVEMHPDAASRVMARMTALSAVGALIAPTLVAACIWAGVDWRWLLAGLGLLGIAYALPLLRARFPAPSAHHEPESGRLLAGLLRNVRSVITNRTTLIWLVFLRALYAMESTDSFEAVWLADVGGMSQALIGVYFASEIAAGLLGILFLERWLRVSSPRRIILVAMAGMLVLSPAWFLVPGTWPRFVIGAPLSFLWAMIWPIARAESLDASARPGALTAVNSVTGLLPVTLGIGLLAEAVGLTPAMLSVRVGGLGLLLLIAWRWLPRGHRRADAVEMEA